jgi:hypothetical protein
MFLFSGKINELSGDLKAGRPLEEAEIAELVTAYQDIIEGLGLAAKPSVWRLCGEPIRTLLEMEKVCNCYRGTIFKLLSLSEAVPYHVYPSTVNTPKLNDATLVSWKMYVSCHHIVLCLTSSTVFLRLGDFHELVWSRSKHFECSEITKRHADWADSVYRSVHQYAVRRLKPSDHLRLTISRCFAKFRRNAFKDNEMSVAILREALSAIDGLSKHMTLHTLHTLHTYGVESRKEIRLIRSTLRSWDAPFDLPTD